MDTLLFHPKIVHLPMALSVLMPLIAGGLVVAWWKNWLPPRSWVLVVALQAILFVSGVVAMQTGESEEHRVERVVAESVIEVHEEAAEVFIWVAGVVLGMMLLALTTSRRKPGLPAAVAATIGTLIVAALGVRTGHAGGELVYRYDAASVYARPAGAVAPAVDTNARDHDDDDD
jgi:uncharacterized membrane protein